ncbi:DUF5060 domain-containing protein [Neorhodopirellula lusitana]|uniref:DUF5060 domain-containing protein n=1 Tax=Neorhodopirellula lusitana TaxID=445327 RepID=UPI00384FA221
MTRNISLSDHRQAACLALTFLALAVPVVAAPQRASANVSISGELKTWHKVTLTVDGPQASEAGTPNPFLDYRMQVTFEHPATGLTYNVPGYFAADGDAANSSATSGNKWRAHLAPDHEGEWTYSVSFRKGKDVAISDVADQGTPVDQVDGLKGSFQISKTDKTGRDFRGQGRLNYVGKHHLQFAGSGEFFLKAGVDAPENLLAYKDFDGDFKTDGKKDDLLKDWAPHIQDWKTGDPTWQDGKGKGLIGAINYLASQGLNSFSFLTMNIEGDDRNAFPYTDYDERERIDCSRMDQWETIFDHGTKMGMYLHFKTQEAENVLLLDKGHVGPERKLYYRELIARFAHHLALNWNLGEEVGLGHKVETQDKKDWANYFWTHDPYQHHIVIHNGNSHFDLLGDASALTGFSLQTNRTDFSRVHGRTLEYIRRSVEAGKPWVVACDEPGDASHSLVPDDEDPTRDNARQNALWGNIMAGGAGVEWYFGYKHAHSDLTCQDYRVRQTMWEPCRIALSFFDDQEIPFWNMAGADALVADQDAYCLADPGQLYLVYRKHAGPITIDLSEATGVYEVKWFNPRAGGSLQNGSTQAIHAGGKVAIGNPASDDGRDWLAVLRPGDPNRDYPPGVNAGADFSVMLPRSSDAVTVALQGEVSHDRTPDAKSTSTWTRVSGPGKVDIEDAASPKTSVTLQGSGTHVFKLTASDGKQQSESNVTIVVEPFQSRVTRTVRAIDDAYIDGNTLNHNKQLKIDGKSRVSIVKFDLKALPPKILDVKLRLTENGDSGGGTLRVYRGLDSDWVGSELAGKHKRTAPKPGAVVGQQSVNVDEGGTVTVPVTSLAESLADSPVGDDGEITLILTLDPGGNDIWFASSTQDNGPELLVTFEDADGQHADFGKTSNKEANGSVMLSALADFSPAVSGEFVTAYPDKRQNALAINAAKFQDKFAAAESRYQGPAGTFDLVLTTLSETDGESSYRLLVSGKKVGEAQNPPTQKDYAPVDHRFSRIALKPGDLIRVEFNTASNGKIPEGDAFAFARGRWQSVAIVTPGTTLNSAAKPKSPNKTKGSSTSQSAPVFKTTYDPSKAAKVHQQVDGIVVVEAEDFDATSHEDHRKWYLTNTDTTPDVKPDHDPNHSTGAVAGAYLELLPDTRVTHSDPLIQGVSFAPLGGQCSVLYYPVEFAEAGRYYVWVRMCCTGSEDNGLHVGLDGTWPESGQRLQFTGKHGEWQWDSRQRTEKVHTGVLGQIWLDIDKPGLHTVMFSMREDGFEFDRFMLTRDKTPMSSKNSEPGPKASPLKSN